ncbi:MAG: four helix bundle protein [Candidatus Hydrogenedentes bacterium]|nr:four helix bundle protein [Candidatus Hydrogenedentota bacterium]
MSEHSRTFRDIVAWQKAHAFVLSVYRMTAGFPRQEMYGLTSQFRRAAISIPANMAEGFGKSGLADKARFMNIAQGSLEECRYYLLLVQDLGYGDTESMTRELEETGRLLNAYSRAIRSAND